MKIVFENDDYIVIDKPGGVLSVDSRWGEKEERVCLGRQIEQEKGLRIFPVHRLDFEVSGLIMYAKNSPAQARAQNLFESREVTKKYEAISSALPDISLDMESEYEWHSFLLRGKKRAYERPFGKKAITVAKFLGEGKFQDGKIWKWLLTPLTGRAHQLRYELHKNGTPIIGDALYGSTVPFKGDAIALRAVELDFSKRQLAGVPSILKVGSLFDLLD